MRPPHTVLTTHFRYISGLRVPAVHKLLLISQCRAINFPWGEVTDEWVRSDSTRGSPTASGTSTNTLVFFQRTPPVIEPRVSHVLKTFPENETRARFKSSRLACYLLRFASLFYVLLGGRFNSIAPCFMQSRPQDGAWNSRHGELLILVWEGERDAKSSWRGGVHGGDYYLYYYY